MKVSVIIPALNEEKEIEKCLISLKNQTYKDFEIILGDGNSEDKTRKIASAYVDKIIIEKRRSAAFQRNVAISVAKGDLLIFTDADSISDKFRIERIVKAFEKDKDLIAVQGMCLPQSNIVEKTLSFILLSILFPISFLIRKPFVIGSNIAAKREVVLKVKGFDTNLKLSEDTDFINKCFKYGKVGLVLNSIVYTSVRRIKKMGILNAFLFFSKQYFNFYTKGASNSKKVKYEPIR